MRPLRRTHSTVSTPMPATMDHRQRVLRALGVTPYRLRGRAGATPPSPEAGEAAARCVLVVADDCDARQRTLLDHIVRAFGRRLVVTARIPVAGGELATPLPPADAYLAFGDAQVRALERGLPAAPADAQVLRLAAPADLFQAAGKRRLWQALRVLRRRPPRAADGTG